jgi:glutathione S-transferase
MLTVHHLGISQSDRIVWLCEELAIPYKLKRYDRDPVTGLAPNSYRALHPFGTAPVITDGDLVLGESGAIIEYVSSTYGGGRLVLKPGDSAYADYLFWFHFANGSMMPSRMFELLIKIVGEKAPAGLLDPFRDRSDRAFSVLERRLGESPYLAGTQFTAADIMILFPLTTMRAFAPRELSPYPHIQNYLQRIAKRQAFQVAMAKADPDFKLPLT